MLFLCAQSVSFIFSLCVLVIKSLFFRPWVVPRSLSVLLSSVSPGGHLRWDKASLCRACGGSMYPFRTLLGALVHSGLCTKPSAYITVHLVAQTSGRFDSLRQVASNRSWKRVERKFKSSTGKLVRKSPAPVPLQ